MSPLISLFIASNYLLAMISYNVDGASTGAGSSGLAAICGSPVQLHLPGPISIVTPSKLNALKRLLHDAHLIGIDTDTKPSFIKGEYHSTSILQLAIRSTSNVESIVIVDLRNFEGNKKLSDLNDVLTPVMRSSTIIKIGQDLRDDFKQMTVAYPSLSALTAANGLIEING